MAELIKDEYYEEMFRPNDSRRYGNGNIFYLVGFLFQFIGSVLVILWALDMRTNDKFMGGLTAFSIHPILMSIGFGVLLPVAVSTYQLAGHDIAKKWHMIIHYITIVISLGGLTGVLIDHNYPNNGKPKGNLYSVHSWIGLLFLSFFYLHTIGFTYVFYAKRMIPHRYKFLQYHKQIGLWVLIVSTAILVTGITRKQSLMGCDELNLGCMVSNWATLCFIAGNLCTTLGLVK